MARIPPFRRSSSVRPALAWAAAVVFGLRAVLPMDFMPDIGALALGRIALVACASALHEHAAHGHAAHASAERDSDGPAPAAAEGCFWCTVVGTPFLAAAALPALAPAAAAQPAALAPPHRVPSLRLPGPPLGPRAPPAFPPLA